MSIAFLIAVSFLIFAISVAVTRNFQLEYNAEYHIGLIADDHSTDAKTSNSLRLNAALNASHALGVFNFFRGPVTTGAVNRFIKFPPKAFYFNDTITFPARIGGALIGAGGSSYEKGDVDFERYPTAIGGLRTRLIFDNPTLDEDVPFFSLPGTGFGFTGMDFYGARCELENTPVGVRAVACMRVEGKSSPPSGRHFWRDCGFFQAKYGIQATAGYYENGSFIPDENHADQCLVDNCEFSTVDSCFRSENIQAVGWRFHKIIIGRLGAPGPITVFDIERGGTLSASLVEMVNSQITLFRVSYYSQNSARLNAHDILWDRFNGDVEDIYCTLFKYDGPDFGGPNNNAYLQWSVRVDGSFPGFASDVPYYDISRLIEVPGNGFPVNDLLFDIKSLPNSAPFETAPSPYKIYSP